jgi:hypothetical protein
LSYSDDFLSSAGCSLCPRHRVHNLETIVGALVGTPPATVVAV